MTHHTAALLARLLSALEPQAGVEPALPPYKRGRSPRHRGAVHQAWSRSRGSNPHLLRTGEPCEPSALERLTRWSGRRESDPHLEPGTLALFH